MKMMTDPAFFTPLGVVVTRAIEAEFARASESTAVLRGTAVGSEAQAEPLVPRAGGWKEAHPLALLIARILILLVYAVPWIVGLVVIGWWL